MILLQTELMRTRRDEMKIGDKEIELKKIKGEAALDLLAMGGQPEKTKEIIKFTIEQGSNAKIEELDLKEIIELVAQINEYNGFTEDFTKALVKKSGK